MTLRTELSTHLTEIFDAKRRYLLAFVLTSVTILMSSIGVRADSFTARFTIVSVDPPKLRVEGELATETKIWSFGRERTALSTGLPEMSDLSLNDKADRAVAMRRLAAGEYESELPASKFSYMLLLRPPTDGALTPHLSWLGQVRGMLLGGDLLPSSCVEGLVKFTLPQRWLVYSSESDDRGDGFAVKDASRTSFLVGSDFRTRTISIASMNVVFLTAGEWAFSDEEFVSLSRETLEHFAKLSGSVPSSKIIVAVLPFPGEVAGNKWSAQTIGGTVLLFSGRLAGRNAAQVQLEGALTHELFHLWVPNALALDGEYGWFYEGFTLYQALKAGLRLGRLSFRDYLNAFGRAYDGYKSARGNKEPSLLDAAERKFTTDPALQYHKGMLVAFLIDLSSLKSTKNKSGLDQVYRELFRRHGLNKKREPGNSSIISMLNSMPGAKKIVSTYVEGPAAIDLGAELDQFGLRLAQGGVRTHISVADGINPQQRDLLKGLGYNESGTVVRGRPR